ncbi:Clp protease N-terminal domain-containing protein [Streptomyces clavuligerus]|uniref:Uncharacterized protein n=1 Tax=Streptomyces clavuligerus TaxID=1901 RepID=B5GZ05_STRCL|nr:Clp protease N-terminal domain-containing protein [Streptomyces clavuligerus]ANW21214.1 hypothetical protein BB341_24905 [Streptomyces clavuligerus]AXU15839.1 hypothetical protein D1794_25870 [Streptomyces clavuligerus]EDY51550.1 conserved hypothetical protein [Streptomyces clavuligerus]EFG05676.1 Hypothetical protein SCLAV_0600 [Streptomyces clavuligerus]MBY6305962.1 hypothetical protein [Streptomyces clavuligerus]
MPKPPVRPAEIHSDIRSDVRSDVRLDIDSRSTTHDPRLTAELVSVVTAARRRAVRDGDRQIDTAHLLHSLIEADAEVRAVLGPGPRLARVLGYLAQRSIGYGLRWRGSVEDRGALRAAPGGGAAAVPGPGTAASARGGAPRARADTPGGRPVLRGVSPAAVGALEGALAYAESRGARRATGQDLLRALAADGGCRAVEVLRWAGADTVRLGGRAEAP